MGATGWQRFKDVTLPLTTPGYISGALLVFIWTFADFVTPLVLGVQDLLAPQAYLNIVQFVDRRIFRMGIVISALLVLLAIVFVLAARQYVAIKDYSSLSYSKVERRGSRRSQALAGGGVLSLLMLVSFIPQVGVLLAAVGRGWSLTPIPVEYTLEFFEQVSIETPKFIVNSFLYLRHRGGDVPRRSACRWPGSWGARRRPGRGAMDALTTLMLAIPGTAIGIAYVRAFNFPLPFTRHDAHRHVDRSCRSCSPCAGCPTRCAAATRRCSSCTRRWRRRRRTWAPPSCAPSGTSPCRWSGRASSSARSSPSSPRSRKPPRRIFLTLGGYEMIPFGIFTFYIAGSQSQAAALGVILIVLCAASLFIVNRIAGTRVGGLFG